MKTDTLKTDRKLKPGILIITPSFSPEVGGVETRLDDLCDFLEKHEYKTHVITYQPIITRVKGIKKEDRGTVCIRRFSWPGGDLFHKLLKYPVLEALYLVPGLLFWSTIFMIRNGKKIDTIHSLGLNASIVGKFLKFIFRKKWVVTTHAIYDFNPDTTIAKTVRWILSSSDKVIALSEPSRAEMVAIGLDKEKVTTHITWVNQNIFMPLNKSEARSKYKIPDKFTVLYVGRLLKIKGIEVLLNIARKLPEINFVFAGEGEMSLKVRDTADSYKNILYLGNVKNRALHTVYNTADVFIMPSQYSEGFGRVVIEALSCGVPVICSNLGGIRDCISDSVGILVTPNENNIKRAVMDLFNDKPRLEKMRNNCRSFAVENFGEQNAETLVKHYWQNSNLYNV